MRLRERRRVRSAPDLTSLLDVVFIIAFVALIRAAGAHETTPAVASVPAPAPTPAPKPKPKPTPKPKPRAADELRTRALRIVDKSVRDKTPLVVRIAASGTIVGLEVGKDHRKLDVPLLERSSDPDAVLAYLGDRSKELHVCRVAAVQLGLQDLSNYLVIFAPDVPTDDLVHALYRGLERDVRRCVAEQQGIAAIVGPQTSRADTK